MMTQLQTLCLSTVLLASSSLWASDMPDTQAKPYGDNPSLGRVLLYKTGKGLQNLGDSIQGASDNTSEKMSQTWQNTKAYTAEQSEIVQAQTEKAKQYTAKKWQDSKEAVVGSNEGHVPIERAELSQPSANP